MQNTHDFMKTKPVFPLLLSMAAPMMLSMLIQSLYNIVDSIFVSRLGTGALTAVSLVYPLQNIILSFSVGIGVGLNSVIARKLGERRPQEADKAAAVGMLLTLFHAILIAAVGCAVTRPFIRLFTSDEQILSWACQYGYIVLGLCGGSLFSVCFEKIFQAVGAMMLTMTALLIGCITNIILDPIFIFGYFGVPAMGVSGAAIATVTGQFFSLFAYLFFYRTKNIGVRIRLKDARLDRGIAYQIYSVGIPSSLMLAIPSLMSGVLNSMLAAFSGVYVAVLGVYIKLQTFLYTPASGIIQAMRPIAGYNYGAGEFLRLKKVIRYSMAMTAVIMLAGTLAAQLIPEQIFALFQTDGGQELTAPGVETLRIVSLGFLVSSISVAYSGLFEALGSGKKSLIVTLLRQLIILVPLGFVLSRFFGPAGIWVCFPISEAVAAFASIRLYQGLGLPEK